ncbi:hypothetical protein [Amycolatopsis minnesotensis]|uniref:Mce-associated membrane protein n=1 Tax=Amycolatopsis minnesotensis TaxID=337894 RepID=A0ABP5DLL3_9PSEU
MVNTRTALTSAAIVVAVGAAGWFGYTWWDAAHDGGVHRAVARDQALRAGQQGIAGFNTLDFRQAAAGYDRWVGLSTGELHDELVKDADASKKRISDGKTVSEAKILDAAVTDLDDTAGTAKVIAAVEIVVTPEGGSPATKRNRFQAALVRTGDGWKLDGLGQVPVGGA